ncbi:MAG: peroxiredoxin [Polyangiales bacterium]
MGLLDALVGGKVGLAVGERAPDFTLNDQHGEPVTLSSFAGQKCVVLYFYPKDDTPGCTAESCSFRDHYAEFTDAGAEVIGVSSDSEASHKAFAEKHRLPFTLVSDAGGALRKRYGVPSTLGLLPGRVTFVIDKEGVVRHVFNSQMEATRHIGEALAVLKRLS